MGSVTGSLPDGYPAVGPAVRQRDVMWHDSTSPEQGNLHPTILRVLLSVLALHTATRDDCWFCVWEGWGRFVPWQQLSSPRWADVVRLPGREYRLARGTLDAALHLQKSPNLFQSPNLFWPANRAWCVASEIDFDSTLVAGSEQLAIQLLNTAGLETWQVEPYDFLTHDSDRINRI